MIRYNPETLREIAAQSLSRHHYRHINFPSSHISATSHDYEAHERPPRPPPYSLQSSQRSHSSPFLPPYSPPMYHPQPPFPQYSSPLLNHDFLPVPVVRSPQVDDHFPFSGSSSRYPLPPNYYSLPPHSELPPSFGYLPPSSQPNIHRRRPVSSLLRPVNQIGRAHV